MQINNKSNENKEEAEKDFDFGKAANDEKEEEHSGKERKKDGFEDQFVKGFLK